MRIYIRASIAGLVLIYALCIGIPLQAQGLRRFVYKPAGRRDPFTPLITGKGKLVVDYGVISSISDVNLEGIVYDASGDSIAIVNGLLLKENDQVGKLKVKKIEKDRVIMYFETKEYTFKVKE